MKPAFFITIFLCLTTVTNLFSQPIIATQKTIGGAADDNLSILTLTKDGGILAGGSSASPRSGEKSEKSKGGTDYWIVKLDKNNKIKWDKTIGGNKEDRLTCLQQTSDGGYILGGYSYSDISGDKTSNSRGSYDYWVVKIDGSGNVQWDKTIGGSYADELTSLEQTKDKGYILGGYSNSGISGEKTEARRDQTNDYWIVKLDSSGNIKWDKTIGGNSRDQLWAIKQTKDGGYILGGESNSKISNEKTQANYGGIDYWVIKLDSVANILWDKTYGGTVQSILKTIKITDDGGFVFGGYSNSRKAGVKSQDTRGRFDYWIIRTDSAGNIIWDKTIGGNYDDYLYAMDRTTDGGYIVSGGSYSGVSGEKTEPSRNVFGSDYWTVKIDEKGKVLWDKTIGGSGTDISYSVREISKNHYVTGGTSNSGISGDKTEPERGKHSSDYWIVYLNYIKPSLINRSSITIAKQNLNKAFSIYPNPVKDVLHVQTNGKAAIILSDQAGKIFLAKVIDGNETINVSKFIPGAYYVKNSATGYTQQVTVIR